MSTKAKVVVSSAVAASFVAGLYALVLTFLTSRPVIHSGGPIAELLMWPTEKLFPQDKVSSQVLIATLAVYSLAFGALAAFLGFAFRGKT